MAEALMRSLPSAGYFVSVCLEAGFQGAKRARLFGAFDKQT